jgi:hypothetical protein
MHRADLLKMLHNADTKIAESHERLDRQRKILKDSANDAEQWAVCQRLLASLDEMHILHLEARERILAELANKE